VPNPISKDSIPLRICMLFSKISPRHAFLTRVPAYIAKFMDRGAERNLIWRPSNFDVARESNDECIHGNFAAGFCCDDDAASSLSGGAQFMTRLTAFTVPSNE
jgi:hypothetical protein